MIIAHGVTAMYSRDLSKNNVDLAVNPHVRKVPLIDTIKLIQWADVSTLTLPQLLAKIYI